jgi:hypothetical protein
MVENWDRDEPDRVGELHVEPVELLAEIAPRWKCLSAVERACLLWGPGQRRGVKWSQVAELRMGPRTNRQPPNATRGNMYLQWSQRTSGCWADM